MRSMSLVVVRKLNSRVERGISQPAPTILLFSRMREEGTREQMVLLLEQMGLRVGTGGRISACRPSWVRRRWRLTCKARFTENLKVWFAGGGGSSRKVVGAGMLY